MVAPDGPPEGGWIELSIFIKAKNSCHNFNPLFLPGPGLPACIRTFIVSSGWMVLWDAARAIAPAKTSLAGFSPPLGGGGALTVVGALTVAVAAVATWCESLEVCPTCTCVIGCSGVRPLFSNYVPLMIRLWSVGTRVSDQRQWPQQSSPARNIDVGPFSADVSCLNVHGINRGG